MRGGVTRNLSLISGLVLFTFAATHFLNHAVGLFNLEAMDQVQQWRLAVTRSLPGMIILAAALFTHIIFGLLKLMRRRTLRLPAWELAQLVLGLAIPFLLLPHIVDTHVANAMFGVQDSYLYELARLWPSGALTQSLLLVVVWTHGCLGIHHWLKFKAWYRAVQPLLLLIAVAIPLAALAGFVVSGREVAALISDSTLAERMRALTHWPNSFNDDTLSSYRGGSRIAFAALLVVVATAIVLRRLTMLAAAKIAITYAGGPKVQTAVGPTLLEISRANGLAHASACGGRARCGTCRVRVDQGGSSLPSPEFAERFTLARVKAPDNARLACQIRPTAPLSVTRLVRASDDATEAPPAADDNSDDAGEQRPLCLLYLRMRDIDEITRDRLAYDVMFILNEFFAAAGAAIDQNFGWVDKFFGDGLLAVFGQKRGPQLGAGDALRTARAIDLALDRLNEKVAAEIGRPVAVSIGIHAGSFVMGRIRLGSTSVVSVVGPGTDIAQQLAGLAETTGWQVALSTDAAKQAGVLDRGERRILALMARSGEAGKIDVIGIARGRDIEVAELVELAVPGAAVN
jgi:adenylate cyclase